MFDAYLMVDWSSRAKPAPPYPTEDAIWYCLRQGDKEKVVYCRTREEAEEHIGAHLAKLKGRVLAGFDFSLAYPEWAIEKLGGWQALWRYLEAAPRTTADRFGVAALLNGKLTGGAAPFWGCPYVRPEVPQKKPRPYDWVEYRATELSLPRRPHPGFQLMGHGSVGSQTLTGIPVLERLRRRFGKEISVWPFEAPARIVIAEVWPSLLSEAQLPAHKIRDARQVMGLARALEGVTLPETPEIARLEGWILQPRAVD